MMNEGRTRMEVISCVQIGSLTLEVVSIRRLEATRLDFATKPDLGVEAFIMNCPVRLIMN